MCGRTNILIFKKKTLRRSSKFEKQATTESVMGDRRKGGNCDRHGALPIPCGKEGGGLLRNASWGRKAATHPLRKPVQTTCEKKKKYNVFKTIKNKCISINKKKEGTVGS